MKKFFLIFILLCLPYLIFAYEQEYVSGDTPSSTQDNSAAVTDNSTSNPMNIYVSPQQQNSNVQSMPTAPSNQANDVGTSNEANPNNPLNAANQPTWQQTISAAQQQAASQLPQSTQPQIQSQTLPSAQNSQPSSDYTDQERQVWFTNCLNSITNNNVIAYAQQFCNCGWQRISSGELPANLLTSSDPQDIKKANEILGVISQECMVDVMSTKH